MRNIIGEKHGLLEVLSFEKSEKKKNHWRYYYKCKCECGKIKIINRDSLVSNKTQSCGCLKKQRVKEANSKHSLSQTRIYKIYKDIKKRCYNPKSSNYKIYGGKGVVMCEEWLNNFMNFYNWSIKNNYNDSLTIDRIDVNGNYEPSNCRWTTMKQQANNKTNNIYYEYNGEVFTGTQLSKKTGIKYNTIRSRISSGMSIDEALNKKLYYDRRK